MGATDTIQEQPAEIRFLLEENYICSVHFSPAQKNPNKTNTFQEVYLTMNCKTHLLFLVFDFSLGFLSLQYML